MPDDAIIARDTADIPFTISVSGIYLKVWTEETPIYSDGGILSFVERVLKEVWYADANATVTVTATLPDGSQLQVSGSLAEAGQEVELGTNFALSFGWTIHRYDYSDVVYARVSDIKWGDQAVDLSNLDLYNPGSDAPDSYYPNWGRTQTQENCFRIGNDGGAATWSHNYQLGSVVNLGWMGTVWAPLWVHFRPRTGKFADDISYPDIIVEGTPVVWDESSGAFVADPFTGEKEVIHQRKSFEFEREWRRLSGNNMYLRWQRQDMRDKGEDVGSDDDPNLNNQACALIFHPINVSDLEGDPTGEWPAFVTVSHEAPIQVVKPPGIDRPADWTGSGGLEPDGVNNDLWHVAAGSENPAATLVLATRKWARLNRIVWQDENLPGMMKHRDLLIINRPNLDDVGGEYLDPEDERIPENEWHWQNYAYARLQMKAPRDADVEIEVHYSTVTASDPCYPTLEPGEFSWSRQQHQVKYLVSIPQTPQGQDWSSVVFDLALPHEGDVAPTLYHVDQITVRILGTAPSDEDWEFDDIYLLDQYWNAEWGDEPTSYFQVRGYDPWDFLSDYTGFGAVVCGLRCLNIPYGYEEYERVESSLKQRQKWRSRVEGANIMDYAKPLRRLKDEVSWQRGWTATYHDPEESAANKDADGNKLVGTFRWWDLLRHHEFTFDDPPRSTSQDIRGAPIVRQWQIVAGIKHAVYYEKFSQGRPHGLAYYSDRSGRARRTGVVQLLSREAGGQDWVLDSTTTPDAHGRWRLGPLLEKGREYRITGDETVFTLANVRYNWRGGTVIADLGEVTAFRPTAEYCAAFAFVYLIHERPGNRFALREWNLVYLRMGQPERTWWMDETIENVGEWPYLARLHPCAKNDLLFWRDGHLYIWQQDAWGNEWLNQADLGECSRWFAAQTSEFHGLGLVYRAGDGNFYFRTYYRKSREPRQEPRVIGPGIEGPPAVCYVKPTWKWWAALPTETGVNLYKSYDGGWTWQLMRTFDGLRYASLAYTPFSLLVAGLVMVNGQPWDADIRMYRLKFHDASDLMEPVTVGHADEDRIALLNNRPLQKLYVFASRLAPWQEGDVVGLIAYVSHDHGDSWSIEKVFPG
ncbi:hypothetical protein [Pseudomonas sp.]|uniref:hypothetical protein n=1 Tax=Pseudomonas sp. TaxID=306 RepID=UPI003D0A5520